MDHVVEITSLANAMMLNSFSFHLKKGTFLFNNHCILICGEVVVLFGSLKGINDGEEEVEVLNVVLELVLELVLEGLGSLKGIRELLLLTVELTVGLLELLELLKVGVTVELFL